MGRSSVHVSGSIRDGGAFSSTPPSHPLPASNDTDEINLANQKKAMRRLFWERSRIGMNLYELQARSGVSVNSTYAWLKGRREPTLGNLVALATALGFEVILKKKAE